MRAFKLQDQSGRYVKCVACGRHVDNELLQMQDEVAIFFGKVLQGLRNDVGSVWLYDNAHVVLWQKSCVTPSPRICMELRKWIHFFSLAQSSTRKGKKRVR